MSYRLVNGQGLLEKGVEDLTRLRPVLSENASREQSLVENATLRKDEWEMIDERVNRVLRERLTVADDLRARGLTTDTSIGTILRVTERLNDMSDADISFDGDTDPERDRTTYEQETIPVPVISKDFDINWRQLEASRMRGEPLDTTAAEVAARKVRDKLQDLITNGLSTGGPGGNSIPGLTTATNKLDATLTYNWDTNSAQIIDEVREMLEQMYSANLFGPFVLYVPKNYWAIIQDDYSTQKGDRTFMERIEAFEDITAVRPNDALADDKVVMVQLTRDVIDLTEAQPVTTVQWEKNPFVTHFRVLFVGGPHIKSIEDSGGTTRNGIVLLD